MIKVVFVVRDEQDRSANSKDYWLEQRGETDSWQFKHCYILVGDKMITHTKHAPIVAIPAEELEELLNNDGQPRVFIDLPIKGESIIKARKSIRVSHWVDRRGYARAWEHKFNPLAFAGIAYTCSNMVGKLLGWNDYYSLEPDDIYNRLTAK